MLIDFMFGSCRNGVPFTFQAYQGAGGIFGIVRDYLSKQLRLAHENAGDLRLLLIALVKSYGVKAQRSSQELAAVTGLEVARCEEQLERLIDLRLARHFSGLYEVSHDFLAKMITEELVDSGEREFKRFRELLSSRATAFASTSSRLTIEEVLFLYKHRQRIILSEAEGSLVLCTWINDDVPGFFWIKDLDRGFVERQLATYDRTELDTEQQFRMARLKCFFNLPLDIDDYVCITKIYMRAQEAGRMLARLGDQVPASVALLGLRSRQSVVRSACKKILGDHVQRGRWDVVETLRASQVKAYFSLFFALSASDAIPTCAETRNRSLSEFRRLQLIARATSVSTAVDALKSLRRSRPRIAAAHFGEAICAIKQGRCARVLRAIANSSRKKADPLISATNTIVRDEDFKELVSLYVGLNEAEVDTVQTPAVSGKAESVASAIRQLMTIEVIAHVAPCRVQARQGRERPWRVRRMASKARIARLRAVSTTDRMSA